MSEMCGARDPHWVAAAASAALGVAGSIFGAAKARQAEKNRAKALRRKETKEKAWYDKAYNTDYLDTKAGQNLLRRAQEVQDNYIRKADGAAAIGGGTAASSAMAKEAANRTMGNTIANIGAQDTARKQQIEDLHNQNQMSIEDQKANLAHESAMNTTNAAQNMSNAMFNAAVSFAGSGKSKGAASNTDNSTPSSEGVPTDGGGNASDENVLKQKLLNQSMGILMA